MFERLGDVVINSELRVIGCVLRVTPRNLSSGSIESPVDGFEVMRGDRFYEVALTASNNALDVGVGLKIYGCAPSEIFD